MHHLHMMHLLVFAILSSCSALTVVDMTFELGNDTLYWPGNPTFEFEILARGNTTSGYWYESNTFSTPEHGGTHVDAPAHFAQGAWRVEEIPARNLVGPAVVVDVKAKVEADPDYLLSVEDIQDWEKAHGRIPKGAVVIMNSGWGNRYPDPPRVFNTDQPTTPSTFHFPGVHPATALFLAEERDVIAVGVDTPSTDHGQSTTFETHVVLGTHNIIGLENLANVDSLPSRGATVVVGLVNLRDGSGGPARILGIIPDGNGDPFTTGSGSDSIVRVNVFISMFFLACCLFLTSC